MSKVEAKEIAKKYALALQRAHFPFQAIYLFGSHVKGVAHSWSDIDIAVVSDQLDKDYDKNRWRLWQLRMGVDTRIEPHGFSVEDFENEEDPMAYEIRKTGIKVA